MRDPIINSLLDLDLYKFTQALHACHYFPEAEVHYDFVNRTKVNLANFIDLDELQEQLAHVRTLSLSKAEKGYLQGLPFFESRPDFIKALEKPELPPVRSYGDEEGKLGISVEGPWFPTILWETIILSIVNELYYRSIVVDRGLDLARLHAVGFNNIADKVAFFKANPILLSMIIEFGTRRRFSQYWQRVALQTYLEDAPGFLIGTSNVKLAMDLGIKPIGTMAHELFQFYAAYHREDLVNSQQLALNDWWDLYGDKLAVGLTDTYGSKFYFDQVFPDIADKYVGHRHDSGCPHDWTRLLIDACYKADVDPKELRAIYSDGLNPQKMLEIAEAWDNDTNVLFGWGTTCTNDLGLKPISIVVKMTGVKKGGVWIPTVKLSDNMNKAIGPKSEIDHYKIVFEHNHNDREDCIV